MLQINPMSRPSIEELEKLPLLQHSLTVARLLVDDHKLQHAHRSRMKEVAAREAALDDREAQIMRKEESLAALEKQLKVKEAELAERERSLAVKAVTDKGGVASGMTSAGFRIHHDAVLPPPVPCASRGHIRTGAESAKENTYVHAHSTTQYRKGHTEGESPMKRARHDATSNNPTLFPHTNITRL